MGLTEPGTPLYYPVVSGSQTTLKGGASVGAKKAHEASASATGYLFQCRYALLAGLQVIQEHPDFEISVERFDDVAFESAGEPVKLIQTKHHISKNGNLTDASVDLWKTLLIWAKKADADVDSISRTQFVLLTTACAPEASAASLLRMRDRDEEAADVLLMKVVEHSTNSVNMDAYSVYKALPQDVRLRLLRAITILDGSPNILDVRDDIVRELYHSAGRLHVNQLVERLEGWWFSTVIEALSQPKPAPISVLAIDQRIDELREEFRRDSLPVDFGSSTPPASVVAELDSRPFVLQLRKINVGQVRVEYAIRDYYRASEQRSRWAREDLVVDGELARYEQELVEAWQPRHAAAVEELRPSCTPDDKVLAGQLVFKSAEQEAIYPLRSVRERFLTHGSYHMLSNRYAVGWHPDFSPSQEPGTKEAK